MNGAAEERADSCVHRREHPSRITNRRQDLRMRLAKRGRSLPLSLQPLDAPIWLRLMGPTLRVIPLPYRFRVSTSPMKA